MINDQKLTREYLEQLQAYWRGQPECRHRDEGLRLCAFGLALLERAGVQSVADLVKAIPDFRSQKELS